MPAIVNKTNYQLYAKLVNCELLKIHNTCIKINNQ